jgi:ribosomal protein S18 acetylase RimI-like enzyme
MSSELRMVFEPEPSLVEERELRDALGAWNVGVTGHDDYAPANFLVRDGAGRTRGGVLAYVWARWLHVDVLWVEEALRGRSWGTRLMEAAHSAGREHGAEAAFLDTFSWQARPFYERLGYRVTAEVEMPDGFRRFYMVKTLT